MAEKAIEKALSNISKRHPVKRCLRLIVVQIKGVVLVLHEDSKCHEFRKLLTKP